MSPYDLIVIGSGFGGTLAATPAVLAGKRVLLLEAGDWVARGPHNWGPTGLSEKTPYYSRENPFSVLAGGYGRAVGTYACVGGASVFYGGVAMRMRESDFLPDPLIDHGTGAAWPYRYADIEPFYSQAESLLQVAGATGVDPTDPPRSAAYPRTPGPLAPISQRIADAARSLGLHPFRLPLAINYGTDDGRSPCPACGTCDGFACAVQAKNDLSTVLMPRLQRAGLELAVNTKAVRLEHAHGRITSVVCTTSSGRDSVRFEGQMVVVAAGALATPRLLLASGLQDVNPAGAAIGRYLMRHCNSVVMGLFSAPPAPHSEFHKQIGIHDYYFGHPSVDKPRGRLGCIQQFATPEPSLVRSFLPFGLGAAIAPIVSRTTGFIVMAEDRPRATNRVELASAPASPLEIPRATITHEYDPRDLAARHALVTAARHILKRAGALATYAHPIKTFSHALGTVRLGVDPATSPLDAHGTFRGVANLFVTDGSALPRAAGVNPSLTIAANALRTGTHLLGALVNMRLAFLGTGLATKLHSRTLKSVAPDVARWYASRDPQRADAANKEFGGAGAFSSYDAALADPNITVVLVALPPAFHLDWTIRALEAGKHVILEKPPLLASADFAPVRAAADRAGRQVLVAENYFYKPLATTMRRAIARGDLGDLRFIKLTALKRQSTGDWRDDPALSGQGALFEGGIHWISLLANIGLTVTRVRAARGGPADGLDRSVLVTIEYAEGAVATLAYSWEIGGFPNGVRWSACYGTAGTLHFETNGLMGLQTGRRMRVFVPGLTDLLGYRAMLADFFEAIRHSRPPAYTLALAERDLRLVEDAYASLASLKP